MLANPRNWPLQKLSEWARENRWRDRVKAYDFHLDAITREAREELLKKTAAERMADDLELLSDARALVADQLTKRLADARASLIGGTIKDADLVRLLKYVVELTRLVHGDTTANVGVDELAGVSLDNLREARRLIKKA